MVQARLGELFPSLSLEKGGWDALFAQIESLFKEIKDLKDQLAASQAELHKQAGLNSSLIYRTYELEQAVGVLEKQVAGERAMAQGAVTRVKYLEALLAEYSEKLSDETKEKIAEILRRKIYLG